MTLMPVSKSSSVGSSDSKSGAGRWIGQRSAPLEAVFEVVDGLAEHVEEAAQRGRADGHGDRRAGVDDLGAARQAVGGVHGHGAHLVVAQVLLHLGDQVDRLAVAVDRDLQRVVDGRQLVGKVSVDHGADDLHDASFVHDLNSAAVCRLTAHLPFGGRSGPWRSGSAERLGAATTSRISWVIDA